MTNDIFISLVFVGYVIYMNSTSKKMLNRIHTLESVVRMHDAQIDELEK